MNWEALRRPTAEARVLSSSFPSLDSVVIVNHSGFAAGLAIPLVSSAAVLASIGRRLSSQQPVLLVLSVSRFDDVALSRLSLLSDLGAWQVARVSICARKSCILVCTNKNSYFWLSFFISVCSEHGSI